MDRNVIRAPYAVGLAVAIFSRAQAGLRQPTSPAVTSPAAVSPAAASAPAVPSAVIERWVGQLGSDDYGVREEATVHLIRAGRPAIEAIVTAALGNDLEVSCRSIAVLQTLLASNDIATQDDAADALSRLADAPAGSSADLAADALSDYLETRESQTLDQIRQLGGIVAIGIPHTPDPDGIQVTLGEEVARHSGRFAACKADSGPGTADRFIRCRFPTAICRIWSATIG